MRFLDQKIFHTLNIVPDFYDPSLPLPPHQLIINAIGDADHCGPSLNAAKNILQHVTTPVLNFPARIQATGRADNARILGALEGVVTPKIALFSKAILTGKDAVSELEKQGFTFPLLLRRPGFHEGNHFLRVNGADALSQAVASIPGKETHGDSVSQCARP